VHVSALRRQKLVRDIQLSPPTFLMPSYGSLHSPSLRKMEHSRVQYSSRKGISMGNIIGDPFALATISISLVRLPAAPRGGECVGRR